MKMLYDHRVYIFLILYIIYNAFPKSECGNCSYWTKQTDGAHIFHNDKSVLKNCVGDGIDFILVPTPN